MKQKLKVKKSVTIWGTGKPLREFLFVEDLANAIVFLMENIDAKDLYENGITHLNIGSGKDISISDLAKLVAEITGFNGKIEYDSSKPDGTPRKLMDVTRINDLGWKYKTELKEGIIKTYSFFKKKRKIFDSEVKMKQALITGITGQDGSYLTEILLEKGYEVHGIIRRSSSFNTGRIDHLYENPEILDKKLFLHYGDLVDTSNLNRLLEKIQPDEIYNLAAQSHVKVSFEIPDYTAQVDALGTLRFLDAIREVGLRKVKFYQASTSELFGKVQEVPQSEKTSFYPRSPYGVAKLYGYWIIVNYREAYNLFACNGILFNHESPKRGETFVTRKITRAASRIAAGLQSNLSLGNLAFKKRLGLCS